MAKKKSKKQEARDKKFLEAAKLTQFTSENQPANRGRKPGSRGVRASLIKILNELDILNGGEGNFGHPVAQEWVFLAFSKKVNGRVVSPTVKAKALTEITNILDGRAVTRLQMGFHGDEDSEIQAVTYTLLTADGNVIPIDPEGNPDPGEDPES